MDLSLERCAGFRSRCASRLKRTRSAKTWTQSELAEQQERVLAALREGMQQGRRTDFHGVLWETVPKRSRLGAPRMRWGASSARAANK